jgi:oligopeptide transport system substrate-binding protein
MKNSTMIFLIVLILGFGTFHLNLKAEEPIPTWQQELLPKDNTYQNVPQVFTYPSAQITSLDPVHSTIVEDLYVGLALFEGLTSFHPETNQPVPGLAKSWEVSEDKMVYTFHLRKDAKWSDGHTLTAHDVYYAWKRALDPKLAIGYYVKFYLFIKGAEAYYNEEERSKVSFKRDVGIKVKDDHTFEVTLEHPLEYFLSLTAMPNMAPVPKHVVENNPDKWTDELVSNGPFKLEAYSFGHQLTLIKNPEYWDSRIVKLEKIKIILSAEDVNTALRLFQTGDINWMFSLPIDQMETMKRMDEFTSFPILHVNFLILNTKIPPFDDVRVRKAFSLALDRKSVVSVRNDGSKTTTSLVPKMPNYTPAIGIKENLKEAKRLLAEAGYPNGDGFPDVTIETEKKFKREVEVIAPQLSAALNIHVASHAYGDRNAFFGDVIAHNFTIGFVRWLPDYFSPHAFLNSFYTEPVQWDTPAAKEYETLLKQGEMTSDKEKQQEYYGKAEALIIQEEFPFIPVFHRNGGELVSQDVKGIFEHPMEFHLFKYVYRVPKN